ncbi:NAD(P)H-dependent flavin oxidoreductase [Peribacillus sp. B-H-3]|uniref:NAD(P)H-dependent flavin oxidoreductase n=1 Tax=Peribacillus sp. B-H-3 TaxID=3400420 RepID=UPI003B017E99
MNRLCRILNISVPIIQGGMGNISSPQLAAAISNAGALGMIGSGTMSPPEVEAKLKAALEMTNRPIALNIAVSVSPYTKELIDLAIKYKLPSVSLSAGNPVPYIDCLHNNGIKVMAVTGAVKHAKKAAAAGADIIVGEGYEAAGINSPLEITTLALIPQLADAVDVPVAAAGGIGDGRGIAAMMALGAEGVQMGTRFIAVKEAPFSETYKQRVINAGDQETVVIGRSVNRIRRVLKNPFIKEISAKEEKGMSLSEFSRLTDEEHHMLGAIEGDEEKGYCNSGQIAGLINRDYSAEELIKTMIDEMYQTIDRLKKLRGI